MTTHRKRRLRKECPHCHVDAFGLWDVLELDYFHVSFCPNCAKPVRNSGWSQVLGLAMMFLLLACLIPIMKWLPELPFVGLTLLLVILPLLLCPKPVKASLPEPKRSPFHPDPNNDKSIQVRGWKEDELRKIISDFLAEDGQQPPPKIQLHKIFDDDVRLTFPTDIAPDEFAALVNYLNYPIDFDLTNRTITVLGKTTLTSADDGIPADLFGKKAFLYVPDGDEDFTVVYLHIESGRNFFNWFSEPGWRPAREDRFPAKVRQLLS